MTNKNDKLMKKILLILVSLISCVTLHAQRSYTLNFDLLDYNIENKDGVVSIITTKGAPCYLEDRSAPALPYFPYRILRPANTSTEDYSISYEKELIYQNVDIEGNPAILSTNNIPTISINTFKASKSSESPVILGKDNSMYGYNYSFFKVSPFIYDYSTRSLYFASQITISLTSIANEAKDALPYNQSKAEEVKRWMVNADDTDKFYTTSKSKTNSAKSSTSSDKTLYTGKWDYIIITSEALSSSFQPLIDWKIRKGLRARIITTETINNFYANSNYSLQKKIRSFLFLIAESQEIKWVLLGGDNSIVPTQFCQVKANTIDGLEVTTTPCDMFYSNLSYPGYDWDSNGNGVYGEFSDNISLQQDVYVTRAPVSNVTETERFVNKVIAYETNPASDFKLSKMLFVGARVHHNVGSMSDSHYKSEQAFSNYVNPYWSYIHAYLYDTGSNISGYSELTAGNFKFLIDNGYHFIHNESHAESYFFDFRKVWFYETDSAKRQNNTTPSVFVTSSCCSNAFDSLCISKALMNATGGAITYFGSSRNGFFYPNNNNIGKSLLYDSHFFQNLFTGMPADTPYHFGAVAAETKRQFVDEANSNETNGWRYLTMAINPLGDPEMPIYTIIPSTFNNVSIAVSQNNQVTISTGGISGCTIALVSTDGGVSYFDVAKDVSSYTFTDVTVECNVTITKHNYKPFLLTIPKFSIQGSGSLCGDNVFWINNLPSGCTVNWHFSNTSSPTNSLLTQNSPSQGMCTLSNPNSLHINETLIAEIRRNNLPFGFANLLVSTAGNFSASFNQPGGTQNGITYPTITNTLHDDSHQGAFELREMTISSSDFANCNLSYSGFAPSLFYVSGNVLHIKFPSVSGSAKQCLVTGKKTNECKVFQFYLHILPSSNLTNLLQPDFALNSTGTNYTVTLKEPEENIMIDGINCECKVSLPDEWSLSVVNANTGTIAYKAKVKGISSDFNTSGWKQGVYIIACEVNGNVISKKLTIK